MHGDSKKQKLEQEDNINKEVVVLPDLPLNTMDEILSWLPVEDILRCRCVCKTWCDLTKDPSFIELQWRRSEMFGHLPFVVIIDGGRCLFHNISGNGDGGWEDREIPDGEISMWTGINMEIPDGEISMWTGINMEIPDGELSMWTGINMEMEIPHREISKSLGRNVSVNYNSKWVDMDITDGEISDGIYVASCNGFICISQFCDLHFDKSPSLIYNPITREKIRLPEFDHSLLFKFGSLYQCGFGFDKMSHRYKLIVDFYNNSDEHNAHLTSDYHVLPIITVGADDSWRMVDLPFEIAQVFRKRKRGGFFFNGGFHWLFANNKFSVEGILTLDIITEKFQTTIFSPPLQIDHHYQELVPIQLGNSIGLLHQNCSKDGHNSSSSKVIRIWKILGAKPDGSCDYQFKTLNFPDYPFTPFNRSYCFQLLAVLSNGDFLFKSWDYSNQYLVLYDQQKDETSYFVDMGIRLRDKYEGVAIGAFLPTLMSFSPGGH